MAVIFDDFPTTPGSGPSLTLGTLLNQRFNLLKTAVNTALDHIANTNNPHTVTKAQVGLGNVDNTSDANKPTSTATSTALGLKAPLASPGFTGTPTAPTAAPGTNTTQIATMAALVAAIAAAFAAGITVPFIVMASPDGTLYKIQVANGGNLTSTPYTP